MLLQHTAGANSLQFRHLFEAPEITDRFRLIAYDLPCHGKSVPPTGQRWWEREYRLEGGFLRQVPRALAQALDLERPAFMGCSVGGLLALDLALRHATEFRAVVALEGALHIPGSREAFLGFWHPQVSNHAKAALMEELCSPTSPLPYVKEVSQVYASGWPPSFWGDLYYYLTDFDIRDRAGEIDAGRVAVHIMNGEHDFSGTVEAGLEAHQAIAGSTHTVMKDVGHFPMQENPAAFISYLLPVLDEIEARPH
ncbi:MAG: alpha/beta fold hydrolase [Acidimicrobiia bacterium]|nr:alpha/beta fold hydrolase [Acidimicrobiia bacterium]